MNSIDLIIGGLIVIGLIRGIIKGLILEVASLFALIAGIYGAIHFSYFISSVMHNYVSWDEKNIEITAFYPYIYPRNSACYPTWKANN